MAVDRDKVLQTAQKLVERKRFDKAIAEYQKLVADDPKDVRTLLKIGDLYLKTEEYVEAITTYERVGQFYSLQGFALKAIAVYKQIREIIHKHVPQYEDRFGHIVPRLAEIYTQLGLTSDALAAYDEVATRLLRAGRDRDAIDIFKRVVDLDTNNPLAYLRLAEALIRVRDYDAAIQRFGTAAELLLKLGRRDDALKVVERLLQHRPDARFARMAAEIYLDRGDPSDGMSALTKLQIAFKENPRDLETLALLARAFDLLGQPAKAIEVQKESARIAKEAGRVDQFAALVSALITRAPNDEGVRQLASQIAPSSRSTRASIDVELDEGEDDEEAEELDVEDDEPASAVPIPLRASQPSTSPIASPRQLVAHAESLRRDRQYEKAVALLKGGVARLPAARELREKLCDVLIEAGDQDAAVEQMLAFAQQLASEDAVDDAARLLDEVLLLDPGNAQATEMLNLLGYAVPQEDELADEEHAEPEASPTAGENDAYASEVPSQDLYDPDAPLPAYTLDEDGVVEALPRRPELVTHLDDPFANEPPLPSFPIEDVEEVEDVEELEAIDDEEEETASVNPSRVPEHPLAVAASQAPPPASSIPPPPVLAAPPPALYSPVSGRPASVRPASGRSVPPGSLRRADALDEDALEEVEFFAQHGMFDEARNILEEQLARLPNHPLLMERLREVTELASDARGVVRAATDNESGTRAVPRGSERPDEDRAFDIAESLKMIDELEVVPGSVTGVQDDPRQISVESVFEQFKAGVAAQISESDASTHYDLGVAYKEMGLYADAIGEFELAARDPGRECVCQSMIGVTHLQMGNIEAGIDALIRGLHASHKTVEQELALTYEIANAYEMRGVPEQALYYFQRVARMSPSYSDPRGSVAERLRRIDVPKPAARAVGAEMIADEFDAAFDDMLPSGKLP